MRGREHRSVPRRSAPQTIFAVLVALVVAGLVTTSVQAQVAPDLPRLSGVAKRLVKVRAQLGLDVEAGPEAAPRYVIGDELKWDLESFEAVTEELTAKVPRPADLMNLDAYGSQERHAIERSMVSTQRQIRDIVAAFSRNDLGVPQARAMVRAAFRVYLDELQAMPHR